MKMLSATQQTQEEVERTKQQLSFEVDRIKQEADMKVGGLTFLMEISKVAVQWRLKEHFVVIAGRAEV